MLNASSIISILVGILLDAIIFNILYSTINKDCGNLINALIYAVGMAVKQMIATRGIFYIVYPMLWLPAGSYFLAMVVSYFVIGLALTQLLNKLYDHLVDRVTFTITCILMQIGITSLLNLLFI